MGKTRTLVRNRSAISGRFVKRAHAISHPKTSVSDVMKVGGGSNNSSRNRSAVSGRFVKQTYAASHPATTISERRTR